MIAGKFLLSVRASFVRTSKLGFVSAYSTTPKSDCKIEIDSGTGIALATLQKAPANTLNLEFLKELTATISALESDKSVRGVIITSSIPKIFSAGLDIFELYNAKKDRAAMFWRALQEFWIKLYSSPLITVAAINGNCPAGGCLMALSCDYRIMASGNYSIGLNETLLGLVAPLWFMDTMKNTIGYRQTERALQLGHLFKTDEALKVGLVDEVVREDDVLNVARREMEKWLKIPDDSRLTSKMAMRRETVDRLAQRLDDDVETFVNHVMQDRVQKLLGAYIEMLKKRKG